MESDLAPRAAGEPHAASPGSERAASILVMLLVIVALALLARCLKRLRPGAILAAKRCGALLCDALDGTDGRDGLGGRDGLRGRDGLAAVAPANLAGRAA